ncbi:SAM-dependent methyltransferase, partial [Brucella melitensis]
VPAGRGNYVVQHYDFVVRNVPPAQLWVYRSPLV